VNVLAVVVFLCVCSFYITFTVTLVTQVIAYKIELHWKKKTSRTCL